MSPVTVWTIEYLCAAEKGDHRASSRLRNNGDCEYWDFNRACAQYTQGVPSYAGVGGMTMSPTQATCAV
jgi:hypothetical protein